MKAIDVIPLLTPAVMEKIENVVQSKPNRPDSYRWIEGFLSTTQHMCIQWGLYSPGSLKEVQIHVQVNCCNWYDIHLRAPPFLCCIFTFRDWIKLFFYWFTWSKSILEYIPRTEDLTLNVHMVWINICIYGLDNFRRNVEDLFGFSESNCFSWSLYFALRGGIRYI